MKIMSLICAAGLCAITAPAYAGTLQGEVRFGDIRGGQPANSTEYRVQWDANLNKQLNYGVELQVKQNNNAGALGSKVSIKLGPNLPAIGRIHPSVYGEIGRNLAVGNNFQFWGVGAKASATIAGPVSVNVGYRHRQGFQGVNGLNEERLNGGLALDVGNGNAVGVSYYRTWGTSRTDQIGVGITHRF